MNTLINNSHYLVALEHRVDAEGGSNPGGTVVTILKKQRKTPVNGYIEIPLSQWRKFNLIIEQNTDRAAKHLRNNVPGMRG